jgi:hypothetical protein
MDHTDALRCFPCTLETSRAFDASETKREKLKELQIQLHNSQADISGLVFWR